MSKTEHRVLKIVNEKGLHARASAKLVEVVEGFDARAEVSKDGMSAGAIGRARYGDGLSKHPGEEPELFRAADFQTVVCVSVWTFHCFIIIANSD